MIRSTLQSVVATVVVLVAFSNVWHFIHRTITDVPKREFDAISIQENRFRGVREALLAAHYTNGNIGYMPAGVLTGRARTPEEDVAWVEARYVMVPLNLRQDTMDAPYVILDLSGWEGTAEIPDGFQNVYGPRERLILLQKKVRP